MKKQLLTIVALGIFLMGVVTCAYAASTSTDNSSDSETAPSTTSEFGTVKFHDVDFGASAPKFGSAASDDNKPSFYKPSFGFSDSDSDDNGDDSSSKPSKFGHFGNYSGSNFKMGSTSSSSSSQ